MIKINNLSKIFKSGDVQIKAVDNVSFSIPEGQFVSITGRSGSGKSTLLYQLGLLDRPTHGKIFIDATNATELSDNEQTLMRLHALGYIFQDYAILPSLTALENVMVPLLMQGFSEKEAKEKATKALTRIGLGDRLDNLPSQLSGGQQQRVSIARAIGHDPKIVFADEPTANLDSETSKNVLDAFLELNKEGQTIVMVTHEPEYSALTHRIIELHDGKVVSDVMNK
ncbi:MAG: ABC transporter ATP-binding protein [Candidatus Pacebacteria bacterium]|nr:ABC transporter ATP-binding protein [Candidatus Paceibacterota bacterium]